MDLEVRRTHLSNKPPVKTKKVGDYTQKFVQSDDLWNIFISQEKTFSCTEKIEETEKPQTQSSNGSKKLFKSQIQIGASSKENFSKLNTNLEDSQHHPFYRSTGKNISDVFDGGENKRVKRTGTRKTQKLPLEPDTRERSLILQDYGSYVAQKNRDLEQIGYKTPVVLKTSWFRHDLYAHQHESFAWMYKEEQLHLYNREKYNGCGILADDMGLGKTLTALSLIFSHSPLHVKQQRKCDTMSTLIICPTTLIDEWKREVRKHIVMQNRKLVYVLHGTALSQELRKTSTRDFLSRLSSYNIVITNYQTAQTNLEILKEVKFLRIILDESQKIKNEKSSGFQKLNQLRAVFRWCMTGSPISNNISDLYSLVQWLKFKPYNNKQVWDSVINIGLDRRYKIPSSTKQSPDEEYSSEEEEKDQYDINRENMCQQLILRRTKSILNLPHCHVHVVKVDFKPDERKIYDYIWEKAKEQVTEKELGILLGQSKSVFGESGNIYTQILEKLLRVRQCCDHIGLMNPDCARVPEGSYNQVINLLNEKYETKTSSRSKQNQDKNKNKTMSSMLDDFLFEGNDLSKIQDEHKRRKRNQSNQLYESAKISTIVSLVRSELYNEDVIKKKQNKKCVIFSQWTNMLDIIQNFMDVELRKKDPRVQILRLDGSLERNERSRIQQAFTNNPHARVLLASTKACSLGLNLQVAEIAIIVEPWWNPQIERQAIDRLHRLGQKKEVTVYRLIVTNTIEERVLGIQKVKERLADSMLDI